MPITLLPTPQRTRITRDNCRLEQSALLALSPAASRPSGRRCGRS
jgi:hypothetical protein